MVIQSPWKRYCNNPVFLSYALITQDEAYLYVQKEAIKEDTKMGKEVCAALAEAKVQVKEYAEILTGCGSPEE